jgi:23S rRNA (adenine1618-N6)-methyltransferase
LAAAQPNTDWKPRANELCRLKSNGQLDFSDPEAVQQLTKSLLKRDFGLKISLSPDRLCPPVSRRSDFQNSILHSDPNHLQVPNRVNYLLWIQSLLDTTSDSYTDVYDPEREVIGLDIGTGASSIYPLLGCSQRPNWRFVSTGKAAKSCISWNYIDIDIDIDEKSLQFARQNVEANNLQNRIKLLQTSPNDPLLPLNKMGFEKYVPVSI